MLLNKLESGFLVLQTPQGFVAVEPSSFWQRVYLLWTFRNFHELSPLLLNPRQIALINDLFRQNATEISPEYEPSAQIGIVENFVPQAMEIAAAPAAKTDASPAVKAKLPEQTAAQEVAPPVIPIAAAPVMNADVLPDVQNEEALVEAAVIDHAEIAPRSALDRYFAPTTSWFRVAWSNRAASKPAASQPQVSRIVIPRLAAALGALALAVCFIIAFHGVGAGSRSRAHSSARHLNSPHPPSAPAPASVAENPAAAPDATPQPGAGPDQASPSTPAPTSAAENPITVPEATPQPNAGPDQASPSTPEPDSVAENPVTAPDATPQSGASSGDAVDSAPAKVAPAEAAPHITPARRMTIPQRASRAAAARVASKPSGGPHAPAFSRVPASTPTRRTTLTPQSREAMARSAQSYFHLADQQMHQGNYAAANANYKRAWQIEENIAAAKGRLARARHGMQAENESIANRRQKSAQ